MLTAEEKKDLCVLRLIKVSNLTPEGLRRRIELERKDAAEAVRVSSCDWCGGWTTSALAIKRGELEVCRACFKDPSPQLRAALDAQKPAPDFDDEPPKERKPASPPSSAERGER